MRRDYFKLRRNQNGDYQQAVERSIRLRQIREESLNRLELTVPGSLPISEHTEKIVSLIQNHPVLILAGETGSGKTTQIPKLCMRAGLDRWYAGLSSSCSSTIPTPWVVGMYVQLAR